MELTSAVGVNAITGLGTWAADKLYEKYRKRELNKERLGPWHPKVFKKSVLDRVSRENKIHIFKMPGYDELEEAIALVQDHHVFETPLGAVCWRGLLNKYLSEEEALEKFAVEGHFVQKDQVGAFKGNVAALANVADIYKMIFSNLDPARWKEVTLNRAERVTTRIGDFSMLYYDNAKWFHFVPSYNGITPGRHRTQLKSLLDKGHTVECLEEFGIKEKVTVNEGLMACWSMSGDLNGEWSRGFQSKIFEHMLLAAKGEGWDEEGRDEDRGVFHGGVTTKSKEYEVARLLANIIHMALISVAGEFVEGNLDLNNFEANFSEINGREASGMGVDIATFEFAFLAGGTIEEICQMSSAALKIIVAILRFRIQGRSVDDGRVMTKALALARSLKLLSTHLAVLEWNVEDLNMLDQEAWLAGVDDTVIGESSESPESSDAETPECSDFESPENRDPESPENSDTENH